MKCKCGVELFDCDAVEHHTIFGSRRPCTWRCPKCFKVRGLFVAKKKTVNAVRKVRQ